MLPLTLALDVLEPHKSGSNTVNTFTALEADERLIALYADAVNSIIFKEYENAVKSNSADSLKVFMDKYSIDADNAFFKAALLASYRAENTFAGFMGAFRLQGEAEDIRQAMQRATTPTQLAEAEHALVRMIPFDRLFSLRLGERYDSPLRAANQSALFHSVTAQVKDIERKVRISVRGDSPLQLQQAVLRVKVDFVEHFDYSPPLNGPEKDVLKQSLTFHLRPGNNWSDEQTLVFKGVPVQGTYRPGGVGGINLLSRLIGGPSVSADAFDMEFSLLGSRLEYEVGEWQ